jgi:uncharacterized membrane protein/nitrite reductase/ring-hydroxylating ferredoxin subunit
MDGGGFVKRHVVCDGIIHLLTLCIERAMKSKAHFKGHPLHPMLIAFPIAFLVGALVADAVWLLGDWPNASRTGAYLSVAAVASGLIAAIPGLIDYLGVIPPRSSAKSRATWHLIVNVAALSCFAVAWAFRDWSSFQPSYAVLGLEVAGVVLITCGGWLGGTLVYRNQIAVDHRYAAGKWREQQVEGTPGAAVVVASEEELKVGQMKLLHVAGRRIVLARTEEGHVAFDDHCTHRGGSLADGALVCRTVQCPWHGSQFDVRDGSVKAGSAEKPIGTYRVEVAAG